MLFVVSKRMKITGCNIRTVRGYPQPPSHSTITSHRLSCLWLPHIWSPYEAHGRQLICSRCTHKLNCHLLPADTWHWLSLCWHMSLGVMVGWMLRCRWLLHWHLMCIIYYACTPYTLKSDWHSQQESDYYLIFLNFFAYCPSFYTFIMQYSLLLFVNSYDKVIKSRHINHTKVTNAYINLWKPFNYITFSDVLTKWSNVFL